MGQAEVMKFLESCDLPVTRKQIADALEENTIKISKTLALLIRWGEIEFIEYPGEMVPILAGYSPGRRTRFYFVVKEIKK